MTLVITSLTKGYVFQASDRLVSIVRGKKVTAHEPVANKSVAVVTSTEMYLVGYTGVAYLQNRTTDQWLAETIAVGDFTSGAFIGWAPTAPMHMHAVLERLIRGLHNAFLALPRDYRVPGHQVVLAGLQARRRGRLRPFMWTIENSRRDPATFKVNRSPMDAFDWTRSMVTSAVPATPHQTLEAMRQTLRDHGEESPHRYRQALITAVRETSLEPGYAVGPDVMSVTMYMSLDGSAVEAEHHPADPATAVVGYSPWLISPGFVFAPAEISGRNDQTWNTSSGVKFSLRGLPVGGAGILQRRQPRRRKP